MIICYTREKKSEKLLARNLYRERFDIFRAPSACPYQPWFRSADLGFGRFAGSGSNSGCFASLCLNLWSGILELRSDLECLFRVGFRSGSGVLFLYGLLPILNFVGSWVLVKSDAMPSAFLGGIQVNELKDKRLRFRVGFLQAKSRFDKG